MIEINEYRDAIERMPRKWRYTKEGRMICFERVRLAWFDSMLAGTIHERINRRAGLKVIEPEFYESSFKHIQKSIHRNHCKRFGIKRH
jgi:hypothetical protein